MSDTIDVDDHVATALEDAFPDRTVDEVGPAGPSWNDANETVRVGFADGGAAYLKTAVSGDGTRIARERAAIEYADARVDVPVPSVIASDAAGPIPYLATAPVEGRTVAERWGEWSVADRVGAIRALGRALADLHARPFERHGHIVGGDDARGVSERTSGESASDGVELVLETGSWTDVLADRIDLIRDLASTDRFAHRFEAVRAAVLENRRLLDDAPAALLHGDPAKPNCIHRDGTIGFLDWEIAHVGDPARELRRTERQVVPDDGPDAERLATALREGYRDRAGSLPDGFEERAPVYDLLWLLSTAASFDKMVEFEDRDPEAAAAHLEDEFDRRLDDLR